MKILGIECSAGPASVALIENGKILASSFINVKLTHSQTLMPMIKSMLEASKISVAGIEGIAVSAGPGSFTGIRIGISAAKGLAEPKALPCVAVSSLRAMAEAFLGEECIVCCVMDARCNQVYNALFSVSGGKVKRLTEDRALMCDELVSELKSYRNKAIVICGDGAEMFYEQINDNANIRLAPQHQRYQSAVGVALCTEDDFSKGNTVTPDKLLPVYLRLPQAERELKEKQKREN